MNFALHEIQVINNQIYPGVINFGGNTGTTNSFAGIDFSSLTGGVYNSKSLLTGDALSCFFLQAGAQAILDFGTPLLEPLAALQSLINKYVGPQVQALECPQLEDFNPSLFSNYPGANFKAEGE